MHKISPCRKISFGLYDLGLLYVHDTCLMGLQRSMRFCTIPKVVSGDYSLRWRDSLEEHYNMYVLLAAYLQLLRPMYPLTKLHIHRPTCICAYTFVAIGRLCMLVFTLPESALTLNWTHIGCTNLASQGDYIVKNSPLYNVEYAG